MIWVLSFRPLHGLAWCLLTAPNCYENSFCMDLIKRVLTKLAGMTKDPSLQGMLEAPAGMNKRDSRDSSRTSMILLVKGIYVRNTWVPFHVNFSCTNVWYCCVPQPVGVTSTLASGPLCTQLRRRRPRVETNRSPDDRRFEFLLHIIPSSVEPAATVLISRVITNRERPFLPNQNSTQGK